jgi:hypothetical protein
LRELLALFVRASKSAKVGAFAGAGTRYEKRHIRLLRPRRRNTQERKTRRNRRTNSNDHHLITSRH